MRAFPLAAHQDAHDHVELGVAEATIVVVDVENQRRLHWRNSGGTVEKSRLTDFLDEVAIRVGRSGRQFRGAVDHLFGNRLRLFGHHIHGNLLQSPGCAVVADLATIGHVAPTAAGFAARRSQCITRWLSLSGAQSSTADGRTR